MEVTITKTKIQLAVTRRNYYN